jgi:hypothetical protein
MPTMYTLSAALTALLASTPATVFLQNGVLAQLTRYEYYEPYATQVNPQLYVPIFYFNIINASVTIGDTQNLSFTNYDIFTADDWIILNVALA